MVASKPIRTGVGRKKSGNEYNLLVHKIKPLNSHHNVSILKALGVLKPRADPRFGFYHLSMKMSITYLTPANYAAEIEQQYQSLVTPD